MSQMMNPLPVGPMSVEDWQAAMPTGEQLPVKWWEVLKDRTQQVLGTAHDLYQMTPPMPSLSKMGGRGGAPMMLPKTPNIMRFGPSQPGGIFQ